MRPSRLNLTATLPPVHPASPRQRPKSGEACTLFSLPIEAHRDLHLPRAVQPVPAEPGNEKLAARRQAVIGVIQGRSTIAERGRRGCAARQEIHRRGVDAGEVRVVEEVEGFPQQAKFVPFAEVDVTGDTDVDNRQARARKDVPAHVGDTPSRESSKTVNDAARDTKVRTAGRCATDEAGHRLSIGEGGDTRELEPCEGPA